MSFRKDRPTLYKVIVKNLSKIVTKDHIDEIFSAYGPINYLDFIKDAGKCYIAFESLEAQKRAFRMNDGLIDEQCIKVEELNPPPRRRDFDDRRGGRGGRGGRREPFGDSGHNHRDRGRFYHSRNERSRSPPNRSRRRSPPSFQRRSRSGSRSPPIRQRARSPPSRFRSRSPPSRFKSRSPPSRFRSRSPPGRHKSRSPPIRTHRSRSRSVTPKKFSRSRSRSSSRS